MSHRFDYTSSAIRFTGRFPFLSFLQIQITFWVLAEILLGIIFYFFISATSQAFQVSYKGNLFPHIAVGFIIGILYGSLLGIADYIFENKYFRRKPLGIVLLMKYFTAFGILVLLFGLTGNRKLKRRYSCSWI